MIITKCYTPIRDIHAMNDLVSNTSQFQDWPMNTSSIVRVWVPLVAVARNGGPSASGRYLGWPHYRFLCARSCTISTGSGNEVIQDRVRSWNNGVRCMSLYSHGNQKRKGSHIAPPPQWGLTNTPQVLYEAICAAAILDGLILKMAAAEMTSVGHLPHSGITYIP